MKVWTCAAVFLIGAVVLGASPVAAQPVIQSIVTENGAAGLGQLVTIQGFDLIGPGGIGDTIVTFSDKDTAVPCSDLFEFASPSTVNELYVRLQVLGGCNILVGKYQVTVSTDAGTSNEVEFQVKKKPHAPIPRRVGFAGAAPCPASPSTPPVGDPVVFDVCIQAYGTDTSGVEAVFSQNGVEFPAEPLKVTISGGSIGILNAFELPVGILPGPALVQLRTTVNGVASDSSFALMFQVP